MVWAVSDDSPHERATKPRRIIPAASLLLIYAGSGDAVISCEYALQSQPWREGE